MFETNVPTNAVAKQTCVANEIPIIAIDTPIVFEDEGQEEMGETLTHAHTTWDLEFAIFGHLKQDPTYEVFKNLDLHYHPINPKAYVSADVMVVKPFQRLPKDFCFYRIGEHGPAPLLVVEVLSARSDQQYDLTLKPKIYSKSLVPEYMLVDPDGEFLSQRLLIRRRQVDGSWLDSQDADGGVTSALGFRVVIEDDQQIRVIDAKTGDRYLRLREAMSLANNTRKAEERIRKAEIETREAEVGLRAALQRNEELETDIAQLKSATLPPEHRG